MFDDFARVGMVGDEGKKVGFWTKENLSLIMGQATKSKSLINH